jgi:hypothetical protein
MAGVHVFGPLNIAAGSHAVAVYAGDVGAPCFTDDGGFVLFATNITL